MEAPRAAGFAVMYFVLVSAALAAFCLVLYGLGLVYGGFIALNCLMYFVLVSAALAACRLVLYSFERVSAGFAVLCGFMYLRWSRLLSLLPCHFCQYTDQIPFVEVKNIIP